MDIEYKKRPRLITWQRVSRIIAAITLMWAWALAISSFSWKGIFEAFGLGVIVSMIDWGNLGDWKE